MFLEMVHNSSASILRTFADTEGASSMEAAPPSRQPPKTTFRQAMKKSYSSISGRFALPVPVVTQSRSAYLLPNQSTLPFVTDRLCGARCDTMCDLALYLKRVSVSCLSVGVRLVSRRVVPRERYWRGPSSWEAEHGEGGGERDCIYMSQATYTVTNP